MGPSVWYRLKVTLGEWVHISNGASQDLSPSFGRCNTSSELSRRPCSGITFRGPFDLCMESIFLEAVFLSRPCVVDDEDRG